MPQQNSSQANMEHLIQALSNTGKTGQRRAFIEPLHSVSLQRRLVLSFGFMLFIPILLLLWTIVKKADLTIALRLTIASGFFGYFFIARPMVKSITQVIEKAKAIIHSATFALNSCISLRLVVLPQRTPGDTAHRDHRKQAPALLSSNSDAAVVGQRTQQ